ncbi:hypothetical protein D3C72_1500190 [compost metagenome]
MVSQHLLRITHRGQVVDLVPFLQQIQKSHQQPDLAIIQRQPQLQHSFAQLFFQCGAHAVLASSVAENPLKPPFFKCTINREMAAGVTPEIRDAWPRVSGRCV